MLPILQIRMQSQISRINRQIVDIFEFRFVKGIIMMNPMYSKRYCVVCHTVLNSKYIYIMVSLFRAGLISEDYIRNKLLCCYCYANVEKGKALTISKRVANSG